jgi:transposase-like protein
MERLFKPLLGQFKNGKLFLTDEEKLKIIKDLLSGNETRAAVYFRYTGYADDHGRISKWMRQFGIHEKSRENVTFTRMSKPIKKAESEDSDFEKLQLQKRISELEKQVQLAEMKAIAFSTMVDIAEMEFKIPIRKKFNTKP